jgi:hypothetical protein
VPFATFPLYPRADIGADIGGRPKRAITGRWQPARTTINFTKKVRPVQFFDRQARKARIPEASRPADLE